MKTQPGLTHHAFSPAELAERGAAAIVGALRARLPDLREAIVLVPDLHAAAAVSAALHAAAGAPVLLLPRITTIRAWAAHVVLARPVEATSARCASLYAVLALRKWLQRADLWAMATELTGLFDELTRYNVELPRDAGDFTARLERAYAARPTASLRFEAQLVHELWWAMAREPQQLGPEEAHQLRLASLAEHACAPLFVLGLSDLAPGELTFLERYSLRAPVVVADGVSDVQEPLAATLAAAWPAADSTALRARAHALRARHPVSALAGKLRLFGAVTAEQEAQAIDVSVREWLLAGKCAIAVVVQDRVVARRARALLERAEVLVTDEAGWALSTTSAATALGRWLDIAANDAYYQDLLDLMKSPFAFHDWPREQRRQTVWRLERYIRAAGVSAGIEGYLELAHVNRDAEVRQILRRVQRGLAALTRSRKTLAGWLTALDSSLAEIGVRAGLEADPAGEQLLELLAGLRRELAGNDTAFSFVEWRRWLARELESATFHDRSIESPVLFTYLAATRLRSFDAVLICGCDAQHLPGPDPVYRVFNQGVRAELGLPTRADELRAIETQLAALIAGSGEVLITWQRQVEGERNLFSPLLDRLLALERLAYGNDLLDCAVAARLDSAEVAHAGAAPLPQVTARPRPAAPVALVPRALTPTTYNALVACPYKFFALHMLGLGDLDEVQELIDKRDYGSLLHNVLAEFHRTHPVVSSVEADQSARALAAITDAVFKAAVKSNYLAKAWVLQWKTLIPAYLDWQRAREHEGWRWHAAEAKRHIEITTPQGRTLVLSGRLDRVDVHTDGRVSVVDYKTGRSAGLRERLRDPGEDIQLPLYALLWGGPVAEALFLALARDDIALVPVQNLEELTAATRDRAASIYDHLHAGAGLPAHGIDAVCEYCEVRGLCRKDYWP